jgi:ABC-type amino acid transport substrate-binding protein
VTTQTDNMFTSCKNPQLASAIDKQMATMRQNGQLKQIFAKYNQASIMFTTGLVRKSLCGS